MWVGSQVANDLSKKILAGNANAAQRVVFDANQGALWGGVMVRTYLNKFSMVGPKVLDIRVHPNMPAGALLMTSRTLALALWFLVRFSCSASSCILRLKKESYPL